jgi:hypothetical protein
MTTVREMTNEEFTEHLADLIADELKQNDRSNKVVFEGAGVP